MTVPTRKQVRRGTVLPPTSNSGGMKIGYILDNSPATQTYTVTPENIPGVSVLREVPAISRDPFDVRILPKGTRVVLHNELGYWVIDGVLKFAAPNDADLKRPNVTEIGGIGGAAATNPVPPYAANYRGHGDPIDVMSGDQVRHSGDGNYIGVLAGGMNVMSSSPFAQVRTHAHGGGTVEVIGHDYRNLNGMGQLFITNKDGKSSLQWRAGSDQSSENGGNVIGWTLRVDAGAGSEGNLFRLRVTTPQGQTLGEIHIAPDGRLSLTGLGGLDLTSGKGPFREDVLDDRVMSTAGSLLVQTGKDETHITLGNRTFSVSGTDAKSVGANSTVSVAGDTFVTLRGTSDAVLGKATRIDVLQDYLDVVVGDVLRGGAGIGTEMCFRNPGGSIFVQPSEVPGNSFTVFGSSPGSVLLGANAIPALRVDGSSTSTGVAPYSAMLYEYFNSMMGALTLWLETHVHATAVGPTSPTGPTLTPVLQPLIPAIQSQRVKLGG